MIQKLEELRERTAAESLETVIQRALQVALRFGTDQDATLAASLTPRQSEVLHLIADGFSSKQIAKRLGVSNKTAEFHRTKLMKFLGIQNVALLVRFAVRSGLVTP